MGSVPGEKAFVFTLWFLEDRPAPLGTCIVVMEVRFLVSLSRWPPKLFSYYFTMLYVIGKEMQRKVTVSKPDKYT